MENKEKRRDKMKWIKCEDDERSAMKGFLEGATSKQLFETCNDLASNPELKQNIEKEIRATLPKGCYFRINEAGFGEFKLPLFVVKQIENDGKSENI